MKYKPLISVIMPVFNGEKFLREAIDSILNQTYSNFEFIIIDDGSIDDTKDIINSYKDDRINLIHNHKNIGISLSLNKAIGFAKGEFIARMDCDDISFPERFEKQLDMLLRNENIAMCGTQANLLDESTQKTYPLKQYPINVSQIKAYSLFYCPFIHPSVMIRAEILKNNLYDSNDLACEDYGLWVKILRQHVVCNLKEILVFYRKHNSNHSSIENITNLKGIFKDQLEQFGVGFTVKDLDIHVLISDAYPIFLNRDQLIAVKEWLKKLMQHNLAYGIYDEVYFQKLVKMVYYQCWLWKVKSPTLFLNWNISPLFNGQISLKEKWKLIRILIHRLRTSNA